MRDYNLYANIKPPKAREKTIKILFVRQIISLCPFSLPRSRIHLNIWAALPELVYWAQKKIVITNWSEMAQGEGPEPV